VLGKSHLTNAEWLRLHGFATLDAALPNFPWPNRDALLERFIMSLARIGE
jgi:hypothetical protein